MSERKVSTDALETLGTIIDDTQKRDAIHLAVAPVKASVRMHPGDHIRVENGVAFLTKVNDGHGIVDPFIGKDVMRDEFFWFVMYPRKVTSLRHVWSHPDFPDEAGVSAPPVIDANSAKSSAEAWLRDWCATANVPSYETVMGRLLDGDGYVDDETFFFSGTDAHASIPDEFWVHAAAATGLTFHFDREKKPTYFSCSC